LGFVGSFYRYEGLRFLLEATPSLLQVIPTAQVLLVGGGPDEPALRQLARPLGSSVILPGYLPHARLRAAYAAMDIFVCPRLRSRLTELVTPLKPLEAMSMARPVLASDVGGLAELLQPDVTGVLFRADDPEALLRETLRLARDRTLREKLGANARADVVARRSWGHVVPRYLPVYSAAQCPH
jgi:glycosyltransferase involved in cell wall biosynthesis